MKLVNPIGRKVSSGHEAHRACMCGANGGQFTGTQGYNDDCLHCGCDCTNSQYGSGNSTNALTTIHRS